MTVHAFVYSFRAVRKGRDVKIDVSEDRNYIRTRFTIDGDNTSEVLMSDGEAEDYAKELLAMIQRRRDARASPAR